MVTTTVNAVMNTLEVVIMSAKQASEAPFPNPPPTFPFAGTRQGAVLAAGVITLAVAFAPALVVAALVWWWAWWMGWPASRLRNLVLGWLACVVIGAVFANPFTAWLTGVRRVIAGDWLGVADTYALEGLAGLVLAWVGWLGYERGQRSGRRQEEGERFEDRQTRHRTRVARRRGSRVHTPLTTVDARGRTAIVLGQRIEDDTRLRPGLIDTLTARHRWWVTLPVERLAQHMVVVGITGGGKTVFLRRLALGWLEARWSQHWWQPPAPPGPHPPPTAASPMPPPTAAGAESRSSQGLAGSLDSRPLCIFLDAKGSDTAAQDGQAWCEAFEALGVPPERTLNWPFWGRLDMWRMPGTALTESLDTLARRPDENSYYAGRRLRVLQLVCQAPHEPPPASGPDLVRRMTRDWLHRVYAGNDEALADIAELTGRKANGPALADVRLTYRLLFSTLGLDFDAGRPLSDLDALYCSLPGLAGHNEARVKAVILVELLLSELLSSRREVLFIVDELSAVSDAVDLANVVARVRSMGGRVVVSAQTWEGFGPTEDARNELVDDTGTTMMFQTRRPEPFLKRAGSRRRLEASRRRDEDATTRVQDQFLTRPDQVQGLAPGEAVLSSTGRSGLVTRLYVPPVEPPAVRTDATALAGNPRAAQPVSGERVPLGELEAAMTRVAQDAERSERGDGTGSGPRDAGAERWWS